MDTVSTIKPVTSVAVTDYVRPAIVAVQGAAICSGSTSVP